MSMVQKQLCEISITPDAPSQCPLCPRLVGYRQENQKAYPTGFNGAVPSFGGLGASILIVGLAPGVQGANRTGRPFTGDYAGDLLYETLLQTGLAEGVYQARADDGYTLKNVRITNAVRCVPPQNKPLPEEIATCRPFLKETFAQMPALKAVLALGKIAHDSVVKTFDYRLKDFPFKHGGKLPLGNNVMLFSSYHCSRYNTNTNRLTPAMFLEVMKNVSNYAEYA
jgi:uracil-DNA glycosylase